ncbi:MAG: AAA family ATPase, partial [Azoarcus sp.]|nr:AAA family ATPase [Azoarcus sp.]
MNTNAARLGVSVVDDSISVQFASLILQAEARFGLRVVVLVDEYDKPILDRAFCKTPQNWVLSRADRQRVRAAISGTIWVLNPMIITPAHECYPRRTFTATLACHPTGADPRSPARDR